jgi:hypothetical protein
VKIRKEFDADRRKGEIRRKVMKLRKRQLKGL